MVIDDMQTIQQALKNLDSRKKKVSTRRSYSENSNLIKLSDPILPAIKNHIKEKHSIDLVLMAGGSLGYSAVEEDAELMHSKFGHKLHDVGGTRPYMLTTVPYPIIDKIIEKLKRRGLSYAVLNVLEKDHRHIKDVVMREVIKSSDRQLIGLKF